MSSSSVGCAVITGLRARPVAGCVGRIWTSGCPDVAQTMIAAPKLSPPVCTVVAMDPIDVEMLRLANARYRYEGARHVEIRERFGINATRFWQAVSALLDDEAAILAHPEMVLPLRRQREQQGRLRRAG